MILQSLHALYDRLANDAAYQIAPPGYSLQKITFKVVITRDGSLVDIQDARVPIDRKLRPIQMKVPGTTKSPGSGLNPCFLWDNSGYMLGYKPQDANPERTPEAFEAFKNRHLECETSVSSLEFSAVCRFLESWVPERATDYPVLDDAAETGFGVFQLHGEMAFVHQYPTVAEWWESRETEEAPKVHGQCLITGEYEPLARIHGKIRGVVGAQGSGGTLAGFNEDAYESYGKKQSFNAPVSEAAALRYVTALNGLLDGPMRDKHRMTLGDTTVAFWTECPTVTEDIFIRFAEGRTSAERNEREVQDEGQRQKVEAFLRALRQGQEAYADLENDPEGTLFFLLGFAPNAARLSVRFFHRGTLAELLENLRRHHDDIAIVPSRPNDPEFPPAWMLLRQTARETKDIPPLLAAPLLEAIVKRARYPDGLCSAVIRRIHADRRVDYLRSCVLKGYLNRNLNQEVSMSLDPERTDPAYLLGRLFAALEKTQRDALGLTLNKTVRDSFYSSASATPRSVFPRLLRTYQHHLAKLEHVGSRVNREKLVQEIVAPLRDFPGHLGLAEQSLFAIGYYHQTRDFYKRRDDCDETSPAEE